MARPTIYVTLQQFCEQDDRPRKLLEGAGFEVQLNTLGRRLRREDLLTLLQDVDGVLAGVEPYDADVLTALPRLRCISRCGIGMDTVDLNAARQRGVAVYTTADEVIEPVAQLTVAMMLALARNFSRHLSDFREGSWKKHTGVLLSEWTIGLVGFGRIGRAVERYLKVFGPRLLVADPHMNQHDLPAGATSYSLPDLLGEADLVSLHAARRAEAGPLLGRRELALMKPGSFLVNTARGFLVDETALEDALRSGHLAGAALDVFQAEPYTGALTHLPNVLCTPHVATLTRASRAQMEWRSAQHLVEHFAKRPETISQTASR